MKAGKNVARGDIYYLFLKVSLIDAFVRGMQNKKVACWRPLWA